MGNTSVTDVPKLSREVTDTSRILSLSGVTPDTEVGLPTGLVPAVLVGLSVIRGATQVNKNGMDWATIKDAKDDVIVEAQTMPDTMAAWKQIKWSGDSGSAVPGMPNQRRLPRATSMKYHVEAESGGAKLTLNVWILWAEITILKYGNYPANAVSLAFETDGSIILGARTWQSQMVYLKDAKGNPTEKRAYNAAGKIVAVAKITPPGVHITIKTGWHIKRERISHDWRDGAKYLPGETHDHYWNTRWVDDFEKFSNSGAYKYMRVKPDSKDQIYDSDAPNIEYTRTAQEYTYETYNNFRQWVEWNGQKCSDYALWYYKAQWKKDHPGNVMLNEVDIGNIDLPEKSQLHP